MRKIAALWFCVGSLSMVGIAVAGDGDAADEKFLVKGWVEQVGYPAIVEDASPILRLVNQSSEDFLTERVGLDARAADNIVRYRIGDDEIPGTADDERIDSLEELDRIPYVGPRAFRSLVAYANHHGLLCPLPNHSPFSEFSCEGPPMTAKHAFRRLPLPNDTKATIGTFAFHNRRRFGYEVDGTQPWEDVLKKMVTPLFVRYQDAFANGSAPRAALPPEALTGRIEVRLRENKPMLVLRGNDFKIAGEMGDFHVEYVHHFAGVQPPEGEVYIAQETGRKYASIEMPGLLHGLTLQNAKLTERCIRLETKWKYREKDEDRNDVFYEHQNVIFGKIDP